MKYIIISRMNGPYDDVIGYTETEEAANILIDEWDKSADKKGLYYIKADIGSSLYNAHVNLEYMADYIKKGKDNYEKDSV